jgi:CelD/BcsL family acetyltransferase involved in cellulose biosynthesis
MRLLLAEGDTSGGRGILAGSIFLMFGGTVFYAFNGRRREDLALRPNDAIQWSAIQSACADGYRRYDFGPVDYQGLADFKLKWGAEPRQLFRCSYPAVRPSGKTTGKSDRSRELVTAAWRRMPLRATEILGRLIFNHL